MTRRAGADSVSLLWHSDLLGNPVLYYSGIQVFEERGRLDTGFHRHYKQGRAGPGFVIPDGAGPVKTGNSESSFSNLWLFRRLLN